MSHRQIAIGVGTAALAIALAWVTLVLPAQRRASAGAEEAERLRIQLAAASEPTAEEAAAAPEISPAQRDALRRAMPRKPMRGEAIEAFAGAAREAGVGLGSVGFDPPVAAGDSSGATTIPVRLGVSGDYRSVVDFLDRLDALVAPEGDGVHVSGRLIAVDGVEIGVSGGGLQSRMQASAFAMPARGGTEAVAAAAVPTSAAQPAPATDGLPLTAGKEGGGGGENAPGDTSGGPFGDPFAVPTGASLGGSGSGGGEGAEDASPIGPASTSLKATPASTEPAGTAPSPPVSGGPAPAPPRPGPSGDVSTPGGGVARARNTHPVAVFRVTLPEQRPRTLELKSEDELPSRFNPVMVVHRVVPGRREAVLRLTDDIHPSGWANCSPSVELCRKLTLPVGRVQRFEATSRAGNPVRYRLRLMSVR